MTIHIKSSSLVDFLARLRSRTPQDPIAIDVSPNADIPTNARWALTADDELFHEVCRLREAYIRATASGDTEGQQALIEYADELCSQERSDASVKPVPEVDLDEESPDPQDEIDAWARRQLEAMHTQRQP